MIKFKLFFVLLSTSLLIVSCDPNENNNNNSSEDFAKNFGNAASKDFLGQVVDENNDPIQNASITIGTSTVLTDVNGVFIIKGASVHEKFAYITAKKTGFIDGSRALVPTDGVNNIKIMMLSGAVVSTVTSGVSSEVTLPNGAKVVFDGNFKTETGTAYSGSVSVIMHHLDPADPNVADKMPGMLFAQNSNGEARVLETYGMMNVELRGSAGQKLQITNTAQIEMPITATQQATAPTTIPLWHFDEAKGYWIEEGVATKTGNKYIGTVSHFSWWNCDMSFSSIILTFNVVNGDGNPLSNVVIELFNSNSEHASGRTDDNGQLSGMLPANEILTMKIYDNCYNVISTTSIGPFSINTILPNIVLTDTMIQSTLVQGSLLKCDDSNVTNGYVLMHNVCNYAFSSVTNGTFSFNTIVGDTNTDFTLKGYDYENLQTTDSIHYNYTVPVTNVGNLKACTTVTEFISYKIDSNPLKYLITNIGAGSDNPNGGGTGFSIGVDSAGVVLKIEGNTNIPGIYTTTLFSIHGDIGISSDISNTVSFNLSSFGAVGEYIDMTFNGTYIDAAMGINHTITGTVHVLRDE